MPKFSVGMFFERVYEVEDMETKEEVEAYARKTAERLAEYNGMTITEIVVLEIPDAETS